MGSSSTRIGWLAPLLVGALAALPTLANADARARSWVCAGAERVLFDNTNAALVGNGGRRPTFNTAGKAYCLAYVQTYHWNNGNGITPGFVGLTASGASLGGPGPVGFWRATAWSPQGSATNAVWRVSIPRGTTVVIRGTYSCSDSSPGTWSQNQASAGLGFCVVAGTPALAR